MDVGRSNNQDREEGAYNGDAAHTHGCRLTTMHQMHQRQELQHLTVDDVVDCNEGGVGAFLVEAASDASGHHALLQILYSVWRLRLCAVVRMNTQWLHPSKYWGNETGQDRKDKTTSKAAGQSRWVLVR